MTKSKGKIPSFTLRRALQARTLYQRGATLDELAEAFGVSRTTVGLVIKGAVAPVYGATNLSRGRGRRPADPRAMPNR